MAHGRKWLAGAAFVVTIAAVLCLIVAAGQPSLAQDGIIYVDVDAAGPTHDGTFWDTAFIGLQAALDAAIAGDEIWVAAGVYTPTWQFDAGDPRSATFQMVNDVSIYGGFDPSMGVTDWEDRDWVLHESILSGDIGTEGDPADNSYHVFYHPADTGLDSSAILDGFTITGGNADGDDWAQQNAGGGMFNYASSPSLLNCTFSGNSAAGAGGGMDNTGGSSPTLTNCTFSRNTAGDEGGGMHNDSSSPTLIGGAFLENTADAGGGIYNGASSPTLTSVTFAGNSANSGGGMHSDGSSPVLVNSTFWGNSAVGHGGGMRNKGASTPILTNCTFHGNRAINGTGGAIQNYESSYPTLTNCILWGDTAGGIPDEIVNFDPGSTVDATYSDVDGGYLYPGTGNINEDPLFLDPADGDFHLLPDSPCIDAGTNEAIYLPDEDFEGDPRSLDGDRDGTATVDMGVDEALWHRVHLPLVLRGY